MMSLQQEFEQASQNVHNLGTKPDNATLLKLYGLFKQGSEGDVKGDRPEGFDFKGAAKYDAWKALQGTDQDSAKKEYIALVNKLLNP